MLVHANAKLGLAGRLALVSRIEEGCSLRSAALRSTSRQRPRTAGGIDGSRASGCLSRCSIGRVARDARRGCSPRAGRADLRCRRETGWVAAGRGRDRLCPLDGLESALARRDLAPSSVERVSRQPLEWPCPVICCTWMSRATHASSGLGMPLLAIATARGAGSAESPGYDDAPRDRRRPLAVGVRRALRRREVRDRDRLPRARSGLLREPWDHAKRVMTDNAFAYVMNRRCAN